MRKSYWAVTCGVSVYGDHRLRNGNGGGRGCVSDKNPAGEKVDLDSDGRVRRSSLHRKEGQTFVTQAAEVGNPLPSGTKAKKVKSRGLRHTNGVSILFVPGWTMPGWIYQKQARRAFEGPVCSAMDPRSQGESTRTTEDWDPAQMARDIHSVVEQLHLAPVVTWVGRWECSKTLSYVDQLGRMWRAWC